MEVPNGNSDLGNPHAINFRFGLCLCQVRDTAADCVWKVAVFVFYGICYIEIGCAIKFELNLCPVNVLLGILTVTPKRESPF